MLYTFFKHRISMPLKRMHEDIVVRKTWGNKRIVLAKNKPDLAIRQHSENVLGRAEVVMNCTDTVAQCY
jgi:hypothetical protein